MLLTSRLDGAQQAEMMMMKARAGTTKNSERSMAAHYTYEENWVQSGSTVVNRRFHQLRLGLGLLLGFLADFRPVLFPNIFIYLHY
jgi:hypothetical protein